MAQLNNFDIVGDLFELVTHYLFLILVNTVLYMHAFYHRGLLAAVKVLRVVRLRIMKRCFTALLLENACCFPKCPLSFAY